MEVRRLGLSGPELSIIGLGCNNFGMMIDEKDSAAVVAAALDAGITHFDTAEMYGAGTSEEFLGRALGARRDEVVIATKFTSRPKDEPYSPGALRRRIDEACHGSLRRLGTDRIDLYYQHHVDREAPVEEALEALDDLVTAGKVRHIACSNVDGPQIAERAAVAADRGLPAFTGAQVEWNLLNRAVEAEVAPAARKAGMGIVPYFPLASGLLTGKYRAGHPFPAGTRLARNSYFAQQASEANLQYVEALATFAAASGHGVLELAIAWLAAQDGVTSIIAGATSPAQVHANAAASAWRLSPEEAESLPPLPPT